MMCALLAICVMLISGCTVQLGNHNANERQGPCEVIFAGKCDSTKADTEIEKTRSSTEGERSHSVDLEAGGQVGDKGDKPPEGQNAK